MKLKDLYKDEIKALNKKFRTLPKQMKKIIKKKKKKENKTNHIKKSKQTKKII